MNIDFDQLLQLAQQDKNGLEEQKRRLIDEYINSLPKESRESILNFQKEIDTELDGLDGDERMTKIFSMMMTSVSELTRNISKLSITC